MRDRGSETNLTKGGGTTVILLLRKKWYFGQFHNRWQIRRIIQQQACLRRGRTGTEENGQEKRTRQAPWAPIDHGRDAALFIRDNVDIAGCFEHQKYNQGEHDNTG